MILMTPVCKLHAFALATGMEKYIPVLAIQEKEPAHLINANQTVKKSAKTWKGSANYQLTITIFVFMTMQGHSVLYARVDIPTIMMVSFAFQMKTATH